MNHNFHGNFECSVCSLCAYIYFSIDWKYIFLFLCIFIQSSSLEILKRILSTVEFDQSDIFGTRRKRRIQNKTTEQGKKLIFVLERHPTFIQPSQTTIKNQSGQFIYIYFVCCRYPPNSKNADEQTTWGSRHAVVERSHSYNRFGALWWVLSFRTK